MLRGALARLRSHGESPQLFFFSPSLEYPRGHRQIMALVLTEKKDLTFLFANEYRQITALVLLLFRSRMSVI